MIIAILFSILLLLYCGVQCYLWWIWKKSASDIQSEIRDKLPDVTVLIPVRNEEAGIVDCLQALSAQDYPNSRFQILLIDDHSTDGTVEMARGFENVEIIRLPKEITGKKRALQAGIDRAKGRIILTIDGDCIVGRSWLKMMAGELDQGWNGLLTGPVWMTPTSGSFVEKYQEMEQAALNVLTCAGLTSGLVLNANGANLAYSKSLFQQLDPYLDNLNISSGDDVFFVQKVYRSGGKIRYMADTNAMVFTEAESTFSGFVSQRIRWAGKTSGYAHVPSRLYMILFGTMCISFPVMGIVGIWIPILYTVGLAGLVVKFITDYLLIQTGMRWGQRAVCWPDVLKASLFQVLYVTYVSCLILAGRKDTWKGRS